MKLAEHLVQSEALRNP